MDEKTKTIIDRARKLLSAATPGPWIARVDHEQIHMDCAADYFDRYARGPSHEDVPGALNARRNQSAAEADAALIAAAPGLLAAICDALESAERRAEEAEAQANECRSVVQMVGDCIEEWAANEFIVVDYDDEPMPSIRRVVTGTTAGRALLDRLHAAEAKVARMDARKAAICGCVSCCSGHVAPDIEDACPDCHGSGAVIVEGDE